MGTINDKLTYLNGTKTAIKNAIKEKGVSVSDNDTFRSYANKISAIQTGSDTSDATATASDILFPKTAYAGNSKITGTLGTEIKTVKSTTTSQTVTPTSGKLISEITVQPIELQNKDVTISQNGTTTIIPDTNYDGLGDVDVTVNVPQPSGTKTITANGIHDVANYASANVNVPISLQYKQIEINQNDITMGIASDIGYDGLSSVDVCVNIDIPKIVLPNFTRFGNTGNGLIAPTSPDNFDWLADVDTSNLTDGTYMFSGNKNLLSIPLFDTSNITTMANMFRGCSQLRNIPVLDTSKVTSMSNMFYGTIPYLTTTSLNNILQMCANSAVASNKTLANLGLTQTQAETCQTLSNWDTFVAAGWSSGF